MPPVNRGPVNKAAKIAHVKSQGQTRDHHCHWPGCAKQCPPAMWGCKEHWFKLPKRFRDAIWDAYSPGQEERMDPSQGYLEVAWEVQKWITENYPEDRYQCLACRDTGRDSRDKPCYPCIMMGRIEAEKTIAVYDLNNPFA